jgi:uncharacterized protein YsxB (DUF464 family)
MINVSIGRDASGFIRQFRVKGHAGYARRGQDIVCAAASTVAYTAAGALEELVGIGDCHSEKEGLFSLILPEGLTVQQKQTAGIILETMFIGFKQIELGYKEFISVMEEEV